LIKLFLPDPLSRNSFIHSQIELYNVTEELHNVCLKCSV